MLCQTPLLQLVGWEHALLAVQQSASLLLRMLTTSVRFCMPAGVVHWTRLDQMVWHRGLLPQHTTSSHEGNLMLTRHSATVVQSELLLLGPPHSSSHA